MILSKNTIERKSVRVGLSDSDGKINDELFVETKDLVERMDYEYHKWGKGILNDCSIANHKTIEIKRGHHSFKELREKRFSSFLSFC